MEVGLKLTGEQCMVTNNHVPQPDYDDLVGENQEIIDNYMMAISTQFKFHCHLCDYKASTKQELHVHVQTRHMLFKVDIEEKGQIILSCEQCIYKC